MSTLLSTLSIEALECITRWILGPDLLRLYHCGSLALNTSLENGGVSMVDFSSPVPCGSYRRGKPGLWPDPSAVPPVYISHSLWRFRHLRSLSQLVYSLEQLSFSSWLKKLDSLVDLKVIHAGESERAFSLFLLPPTLVKLEIIDRSHVKNTLKGDKSSILSLAGVPESLQSITVPVGWLSPITPSISLLWPPHLTSLSTHVILPRSKALKQTPLPRQLQELRIMQTWTLEEPSFVSTPDFFPPSLTTLEISARQFPRFSSLPTTLTDLRLTATQAQYEPIDWEPLHLLVLHVTAPYFFPSPTNASNNADSHLFEWIYKNKTITELSMRITSFPPHSESESPSDNLFCLSKLPPSVLHLSLNSITASKRQSTSPPRSLPSNLPSHLRSVQLGPRLDELVKVDYFDASLDEDSVAYLRKPFEGLNCLGLSAVSWRLPHATLLRGALTTLALYEFSWEDINKLEFCAMLPPTLTSIRLLDERLLPSHALVTHFFSQLPPSIQRIECRVSNIVIAADVTWPEALTHVEMPFAGCKLQAFTSLPPSVYCANFHTVYARGTHSLASLESWFAQHPNAIITVTCWKLTPDPFPKFSPSPANIIGYLSKIPEIEQGQWLKNMAWSLQP